MILNALRLRSGHIQRKTIFNFAFVAACGPLQTHFHERGHNVCSYFQPLTCGAAKWCVSWKECCIAGAWFGGFQALMPLLGYLLGTQFEQFVTSVDHWIAFVLLGIIGGNMIREALSKDEDKLDGSLAFKTMLLLAIATSIDALAVGITFAFLPGTRIVPAVALIGSITFVFSASGIRLGNMFGLRYKSKAEFVGGVILILLGTKILLEHLGVL